MMMWRQCIFFALSTQHTVLTKIYAISSGLEVEGLFKSGHHHLRAVRSTCLDRPLASGFTSLQAAPRADDEVFVVGVWKPLSCGALTCVQRSVADNEELVSLEISAYECLTGHEITGLVSAPTPSQALARPLASVSCVRRGTRPQVLKMQHSLHKPLHEHWYLCVSSLTCGLVSRGVYDDVNGGVTRHADDMALIMSAQDTRAQGVRSPIWSGSGLQEWTLLLSKGAW